MIPFVGIIRATGSAVATEQDVACFGALARRFPKAFGTAVRAEAPGVQLLGTFQSYKSEEVFQTFFSGTVFNRDEVASLAGGTLRNYADDAALVHALIQKKGTGAVKHVNGQYVIIYCDRSKRQVSIINDHLGIQQVLYHQGSGFLIFGTEAKFLQAHAECPKGVDWASSLRRPMPNSLLAGYESYSTWFDGINLLPEATIMTTDLTSGITTMGKYWNPHEAVRSSAGDSRTAQQVMDEYMALLDDAVRVRMTQEGTTYSLLSGGLDSSAVCALAARRGSIETYSIINQTTALEGTTLFCHWMSRDMGFKNSQFLVPYHRLGNDHRLWMQRVWRAESPVNHTDSLTKTMLHYAIAADEPRAVNILTGTGSDQMNGGLVGYVAAMADTMHESWGNFHNAVLDAEHTRFIRREEQALWDMRKLIDRNFLSSLTGRDLLQNPWMSYIDGAIHAQAYSLLWDEQRASASHGHSTFYPFMDYRLAEFIAAIPQHLHRELFYDKQILREPSKKILPDYIANKPKMPYNLPEYDTRVQDYEFLTADNSDSLFRAAFGDVDTPHPAVNKKELYNRILAMRRKPVIGEWLNIMHIINLGLLEQLADKDESDLDYESAIGLPEKIGFDDEEVTKVYLQQQLGILSTDELVDKPVKFAEDCSLLFDTKSNKYYLSKRNNLTYEIDEVEYANWKRFLDKVDNKLTTREIMQELGIAYSDIQEFFDLSLKEQILTITDKSTGY